jgi:acetyltransferase-like isoleucine patch superfamily enzyme
MVKINKYLMSYFRLFLIYLFHKKKIIVKDKIKTFLDYGFRLSISGEKSMLEIGSVYCREYVKFNINGGKLFLGNNIFFNSFSSINCQNEIIIGNDCLIGEGVRFYDHDHVFSLDKVLTRKSGFKAGSIKIGDNVWIGSNSIILKGVAIGANSVIAAGSIIHKDIAPNTVIYTKNNLISKSKEN